MELFVTGLEIRRALERIWREESCRAPLKLNCWSLYHLTFYMRPEEPSDDNRRKKAKATRKKTRKKLA